MKLKLKGRLVLTQASLRKIKNNDIIELGLFNTSVYPKSGVPVTQVLEKLNRRTSKPIPWVKPFLEYAVASKDLLITALENLSKKNNKAGAKLADIFRETIAPAPSIYTTNTAETIRRKGFNRPLYDSGFLYKTTFGKTNIIKNTKFFK